MQESKVLLALLDRPGDVIAKNELAVLLWPDEQYGDFDRSIHNLVSKLRRMHPEGARWIETVPKTGYKLSIPVQIESESATANSLADPHAILARPESPPASMVAAEGDERVIKDSRPAVAKRSRLALSIAGALVACAVVFAVFAARRLRPIAESPAIIGVLPFQATGSQDSEAETLRAEVTDALAAMPNTEVRAAHSLTTQIPLDPAHLHKTATQYGLEFLLAGSLDVKNGTYHLALELIRGRDGMHMKSLHFEGAIDGLGAVPDKLAAELSPQIRQLSRETGSQHVLGGTTSQQAYDLAFRASSKLIQRNQGDVQQAASLYKDAATVDPQFAKAWSGLSESKLVLANFGTEGATAQDFEDARSAAQHALQLDPDNAQAHSTLGLILLQKDWRLEAAETQMRSAIAANSGLASNYLHLAVLLTDEGRFGEAQQNIDRAHQVDPGWPVVYGTAMYVHIMARQYDRAIEDAQALVRMKPEWGRAHDHLGWALWYAGRHAAAVQEWHDAALLDHDDRAVQMETAGADILERLGVRSYAQYKISEAAKGVGSQAYVAAEWYAFAGDLQETLSQLATMVRTRNPESLKIPINPAYDFVRSDPAYHQLMQALPTSVRNPAVRSHQQPSSGR